MEVATLTTDNGRQYRLLPGPAGLCESIAQWQRAVAWVRDGHVLLEVRDGKVVEVKTLVRVGGYGKNG